MKCYTLGFDLDYQITRTSWKSIFWYLLTPVCGRFDYLIDRIVQKTEFRVKYRAGAGQLYHRTRFKIKKET